ncbi:MAG TPA: alpha-L-fucosidase [Candidatus Deferrimicrobium sp.]|nr:alpha-L-fucosidase [Candidatus Deferrimicrobium sp.]
MPSEKTWWEKPGLGIQFQIEARPGWRWNRNYDKFIASMRDNKGRINFNGPLCKIKEWVTFSKEKAGVDYHMMEIKWHDGICYFDTKFTDWKTPIDYGKQFSEESKKVGIPFLYYYSSIFDHNPMFDDIQPLRCATPSHLDYGKWNKPFIVLLDLIFMFASWFLLKYYETGVHIKKEEKKGKFFDQIRLNRFHLDPRKYEIYMLRQLKELIENYKPDGLWLDWYQLNMDRSASIIMDFMKTYYPNVVITFNNSLGWDLKWAHYLAGESHNVKMAWTLGNQHKNSKIPWELIGPAALEWDRMEARADPFEIIRMAAIIMANGGRCVYGMASQMDGTLFPEIADQMARLGEWYIPRKDLFCNATPMQYKGKKVPGIIVKEKFIRTIGSTYEKDFLIHLICISDIPKQDLTVKFSLTHWRTIEKIFLEPSKKELDFRKEEKEISLIIPKKNVDRIDTILRVKTSNEV